jgi:hypothetical protein
VTIKIFVEGGGDQNRTSTACRKGFQEFFGKLLRGKTRPRIVACGSRDRAHKDFQIALKAEPEIFSMLLVDSEGSVTTGQTPIQHLRQAGWKDNLPEDQIHLMVQCMESWFLADKQELASYFGNDFNTGRLSQRPDIENIPKTDVQRCLHSAAKNCPSAGYHKTRDGFEILGRIDPQKVRQSSPHADRFFDVLERKSGSRQN